MSGQVIATLSALCCVATHHIAFPKHRGVPHADIAVRILLQLDMQEIVRRGPEEPPERRLYTHQPHLVKLIEIEPRDSDEHRKPLAFEKPPNPFPLALPCLLKVRVIVGAQIGCVLLNRKMPLAPLYAVEVLRGFVDDSGRGPMIKRWGVACNGELGPDLLRSLGLACQPGIRHVEYPLNDSRPYPLRSREKRWRHLLKPDKIVLSRKEL